MKDSIKEKQGPICPCSDRHISKQSKRECLMSTAVYDALQQESDDCSALSAVQHSAERTLWLLLMLLPDQVTGNSE